MQVNDLNAFSDTMAYTDQQKRLVASCYLIKHDDEYMLWDAGLPAALKGAAQDPAAPMAPTLKEDLPTQLQQIDVKPEDIGRLGISHYHFDHTGQAPAFANSTLVIGKQDIDALRQDPLPAYAQGFADPRPLQSWLKDGAKVEEITGDKDIYGDGSVVVLQMPGHTPGETALLVDLANKGPVIISGDVAHFHENLDSNGVPGFNYDRAQSLASMDRLKKLVENMDATLIIQHDERDVEKLPAFPEAAD